MKSKVNTEYLGVKWQFSTWKKLDAWRVVVRKHKLSYSKALEMQEAAERGMKPQDIEKL